MALAKSKFGGDAEERKERAARPGLRRVDSMDFLDLQPEEKGSDKLGRALRWVRLLTSSLKLMRTDCRRVSRIVPSKIRCLWP